jgi:hypothetical protein
VLCATENGWKPSNSPEPSPINLSTLVPKSMGHADTNQGSIGIMNRRNPPVLISRYYLVVLPVLLPLGTLLTTALTKYVTIIT